MVDRRSDESNAGGVTISCPSPPRFVYCYPKKYQLGVISAHRFLPSSSSPSSSSLMIALTTYILHVYILLPIVWRSLQAVYHKRYDICPLVKCLQPLTSCLQEVECRAWLDQVAACQDPQSVSRQTARHTFAHLQHPDNPAYCQYQSFDAISSSSSPALAFVECIGKSHCLPPSDYSDTCATITTKEVVVPLDSTTILAKNLPGRWLKVYSTGWDLWPCQWTDFWPPSSTNPENGTDAAAAFGGTPVVDQNQDTSSSPPPPPEEWMTAWPHDPNVWRMDLYWKHSATANLTFHMNNEMYLGETWDFTTTTTTNAPPPSATLKTRAVMWGTEAHENWYLLDYHSEWNMMLVYYCAYTEAVHAFDSAAMVLIKQEPSHQQEHHKNTEHVVHSVDLTTEQSEYYETKARKLLGDVHGRLQRIQSCEK